ncbi:MAG: hypothetical protein ACE5HT_04640 [Gemmatimonadales bacterium]
MTRTMIEALEQTPEMPDNLTKAVSGAREDGDAFLVTLTDDDAMAMAEMCQWYIKSDPVTGELTDKAKLFSSIIDAIDDCELG